MIVTDGTLVPTATMEEEDDERLMFLCCEFGVVGSCCCVTVVAPWTSIPLLVLAILGASLGTSGFFLLRPLRFGAFAGTIAREVSTSSCGAGFRMAYILSMSFSSSPALKRKGISL
jgi:uncharacterized membrane protein YeaQ/YmgE (transglycosylase-associated protein family)